MTDDPTLERSALVWVQLVMSQLTTGHPTDGMNEVSMIEIVKPILIRVVGVGVAIEIMNRRVFDSVLVMGILGSGSEHMEQQG